MDAKQVRIIRKKLGLTQKEMADRIGVSLKTVTNYETGGVIPESKLQLLQTIARDMFNGPGTPPEKPKPPERDDPGGSGGRTGSDTDRLLEACERATNAAEKSAETARILAETNSLIVGRLFDAVSRIEASINKKGAAGGVAGAVPRAAQG